MDCKQRLEAFLRENGVSYEVQQHRVAFTAQEVAASEHVPGEMLIKVVMVKAGRDLVMCAVPAPHQVNLRKLEEILGKKEVRLAHEEEFGSVFGDCEVGAMPPFGNLYGLPVYADKALSEEDKVVFQACTHSETMTIRYADFERLVKPTIGEFSSHPGAHKAA